MQKITLLLITTMLATFFLAGCGTAPVEEQTVVEPPPAPVVEPAPKPKPKPKPAPIDYNKLGK